jgi:hypothetical protein
MLQSNGGAMLTSSAFVTWILHNQPVFVNEHGVNVGYEVGAHLRPRGSC